MDDTFLDLIASIKGLDWTILWKITLLAFMRFAAICSITPFFGARLVPMPARVGLALSLTVVFLPTILINRVQDVDVTDMMFAFYSLKELMIGFMLGYLASVPFFVAQSSGIFIDYARGASSMLGQDATTQSQVSTIGIMMNYYMVVIFFALNGPLLFLNAVGLSFEVIPVDSFAPLAFVHKNQHFWTSMMDLMNQIFTLAIELGAPSLLAILMAESFLGIANRLAPNVQIAFLGMPLKSLLGLTMLWAGWYVISRKLGDYSIEWIETLEKLIPFLQK